MSYACFICPKSFSESGQVSKHKIMHTKEKPYTCPMCPITFSESGCLNKHIEITQKRSLVPALYVQGHFHCQVVRLNIKKCTQKENLILAKCVQGTFQSQFFY